MPKDKPNQRQMQEEMEKELEKKLQEVKDKERNEAQCREAVRQLSRVPGNCPVGKCSEIVFPSNMMMHMLHKHMSSYSTHKSEIYDHKPVVLCFDPIGYEYGHNQCVATFLYGGVMGEPNTQPGLSYLCMPNSALINDRHKYDNYLPIMLMCCRSTWYAQLKDKQLERELVAMNASKAGIYVFWLVAPTTTRKLYYTLTVYDRYYLNSRSVIRVVRDYTGYQNPSEFVPYEDNYLLLRDTEIQEYLSIGKSSGNQGSKHLKPGIPMELIIYENPMDPPVRHSNQKELHDALEQMEEEHFMDHMPRNKASVKRSITGKLSLTRRPRSKMAS